MITPRHIVGSALAACLFLSTALAAAGAPFKDSFGDLRDDLADARGAGRNLVLVFGMDGCAACRALEERTLRDKTVRAFLRERYDLVRLDLRGTLPITAPNGERISESEFAAELGVFATPTLIVLDREGRPAKRLVGALPPATFIESLTAGGTEMRGQLARLARPAR